MSSNYNRLDKSSIINFAKELKDKSLSDIFDESLILTHGNKGSFGQLLEKYYFEYEPNSSSEPDFKEVGMELKTSPLKRLKNGEYRSKERLVLNIINYFNVVEQQFETSDFIKKNLSILMIFYVYEQDVRILDYVIKLVDEWNIPSVDLEIIKKDWEFINDKIKSGKAHELSEGDTFYLGACTKGANANSLRKQPFSSEKAKQRAYSFKQGYVNHIIASIAGRTNQSFGKLITSPLIAKKHTIEELVLQKFEPFIGKNVSQIVEILNKDINTKAKGFYASLTKAILGIDVDKEVEEFQKANIQVKTIRLKNNGIPSEDISFPTFRYDEIVYETWEDANIKDILENKFLFVFYQYTGIELILKKVKFWNMPYKDILEVEKVWNKTRNLVLEGNIVKGYKVNKNGESSRLTNFPSKKDSSVAHVRPHARDAQDCFPLPVMDQFTKEIEYTKHCFWLNSSYVYKEIYLK